MSAVRTRNGCLAVLLAALAASTALANGVEDFKLAQAIPSDAFMVVCTRGHDGQAFLDQQMTRLWAEVEKARFDRDLKKLFKAMSQQDGGNVEDFEAWWQQLSDLAVSVDWASLSSREYAMGMKLTFPMPELVVLMKPAAEKLEENFDGLSGIIKEFVNLDPAALQLSTEGEGSKVAHRVSFANAPFPVALTLARENDVIIFGFGTTMCEQAVALLNGEQGRTITQSDRFTDAVGKLPAPTDSVFYMDIAKLFTQMRGMMEQGITMTGPPPQQGEPGYERQMQERALPGKLLDELDIFEYCAAVKTTDGMKSVEDSVCKLKTGAADSGLYKVLFSNGVLKNPLEYVPVDAGNVSATSGLDPLALCDAIVSFVNQNVPDGEQATAMLDMPIPLGEGQPLSLKDDVIGWIQGGFATYSIPGPTAYSPGEFVYMISVRDQAKGKALIDMLLNMAAGQFAQQLAIEDATVDGAEGFRSIRSPMLGMIGMKAPTVGFHDGHLFIGSSPEIISRSLAVAAGSEDNFTKNERFQKEGIPLGSDVMSMSFQDMTKFGEQLGQALNMVGMLRMMIPPEELKNPVLQAALNMVPKVGRVVRKLDFLLSSASQSTLAGDLLLTKKITNYREPPVITKPAPPDAN